jgi:hypothetical protein
MLNYITFDSAPAPAAAPSGDSGEHYRQLLAQLLASQDETSQQANQGSGSLLDIMRLMKMKGGMNTGQTWTNPDTGISKTYGGSGGLFGSSGGIRLRGNSRTPGAPSVGFMGF